MFGVRKKVLQLLIPLIDLGLTAAAFITAYFIKKYLIPYPLRGLSVAPNYYTMLLLTLTIWYLLGNHYGWVLPVTKKDFGLSIKNAIRMVLIGMMFIVSVLFMFKITDISRIMMALFCVYNILFLVANKIVLHWLIMRFELNQSDVWNILIIGSRQRAIDIINELVNEESSQNRIIGCLEIDKNLVGKKVIADIGIIGLVKYLKIILLRGVVDEIIIAMPLKLIPCCSDYIELAEKLGIEIRIVPDWQIHSINYKSCAASARIDQNFSTPTMVLNSLTPKETDYLVKIISDYLFAGIGIVLMFPLFLVVSLLIKIFSPGPVFFRQERLGLHGRKFTMLKFRTMVVDAEKRRKELTGLNEADGPVFKIKDDPRIIPYIGKFLRKTNLDEIPQLINILRGEMSLVGPRPPLLEEVQKYDLWQRRRLSMKPGLTCLWQTAPNRNDLSFEDWMRLDLQYIDRWSLSLDIQLIARTVKSVLLFSGR